MLLTSQIRRSLDFLPDIDLFRSMLARIMWMRYQPSRDRDSVRSIVDLCGIARLSDASSARDAALQRRVEAEILECVKRCKDKSTDWPSLIGDWKPGVIEKAVILKPYIDDRERGVILISFEYQFARLMAIERLADFAKHYAIVIAPTWSLPHSITNSLLPAQYPDKRIFTLISNRADINVFPRLSPKWNVIPLYASNWVNPDLYKPVPFRDKHIDIVMLANFSRYKRHFDLFKALRKMPTSLKVVLIGQPSGNGTAAGLLDLARSYGVEDRITIKESVSNSEVMEGLTHAKISLVLSRREGSCVAVVESIFANTPVGLYRDAQVGSREFINNHSGAFLGRQDLGKEIMRFIERSELYSPRDWAVRAGVGCRESTDKLNEALRVAALADNQRWTVNLAVHYWNPNPLLLGADTIENMRAEYLRVQQRYGLTLGTQHWK